MSAFANKKRKLSGSKPDNFVSLESKVSFLKRGQHYSESPKRVFHQETHMSWVFMTDVYAYKLKKANRLSYLDFSTVRLRKEDCEREVRLNSMLAKDIYLRIVPLNLDQNKQLQIDGEGKVIDWLVKMRKLDKQFMLDELIKNNTIDEPKIIQAAEHLTTFYQQQPAEQISTFDYWNNIMRGVKENYTAFLDQAYQLPIDEIKEVITALQLFLTEKDKLLEDRVKAGKIIEGHGDLRPEHINLDKKPVIIDRLAFNRDLRIVDVGDELAFLSMECELLGNEEVGKLFIDTYTKITDDHIPDQLLTFYKCNRACLRAKLALEHLKDSKYKHQKQWVERANRYLQLASNYAKQLH